MRAAMVQATFNEKMAGIVMKELAYSSIAAAFGLAWWWGWQWFFWGIVLIPIVLVIGLCIPIVEHFILCFFAAMWALPFCIIARLGIDAFYLFALVAFFYCFWVHRKAFTYFEDISRSDDGSTW